MKKPSGFGARLREARLAQNITPDELGIALGDRDGGSVRRWETTAAIRLPRAETLLDIAKLLGVSVEWLANGIGHAPAARARDALEEQIVAILARYHKQVAARADEEVLQGYWELLAHAYSVLIREHQTVETLARAMARITAGTEMPTQNHPAWVTTTRKRAG